MDKGYDSTRTYKTQKGVRNFIDKAVGLEKIVMCLEVARLAPSACNSQPWKFIVVDDRQLIKRLCDVAFSGVYSTNSFCKTAPVIVAVVSEKSKFLARVGGMYRGTEYHLTGIACEHFVLQAVELGLGTCFISWFDEGAIKAALNVPQQKKIDIC